MSTSARIARARRKRWTPRGASALAACLAIAGACKTATPDEVFGFGSGLAGSPGPSSTNGGMATGAGGSVAGGNAAVSGAGQTFGVGGEAGMEASAGAGESAEPEPEPGEDCGPAPAKMRGFSRSALREAAADCAIWQYCQVESAMTMLRDAVAGLRHDSNDSAREAAQKAWRSAMSRWSVAELFQFGPAGSKAESAGKDPIHGQGLRDLIHAWPVVARCRVEEQLLGRGYERSWAEVPISGRGLFGLEYLLFFSGADHGCSPSSTTGKGWAALDTATLATAKLDYATALSSDVLAQARRLREAWSPDGGNFRKTLIEAQGYESEQQALNVIAWSLLYLEKEVKDWKVGIPAGVTLTSPVGQPEAPYALGGSDAIRQNIRGFRALFQGCGENGVGLGFDDWLNDVGQSQLATDMLIALDGAAAAADAFPPLDRASPAELSTLYQALRALTLLLKADFFGPGSTLNLKLPAGVASDTD